MASTSRNVPHIAQGGFDRSLARYLSNAATFWELLNLRPERGRLVQTKGFGSGLNLTTLASETASPIKLFTTARNIGGDLRYLVANHETARFIDPTNVVVQVLIPTIRQTRIPNTTGIHGQCLLYNFNATDFAANLDYVEVKITGSTTFQWSINGGAWSSNLTIGPEVSIGSNGLKVAFQQAGDGASFEGYTTDDLWRWQRFDKIPYTGAEATCLNFPFKVTPYNTDNYIAGISRNIMRVRDSFLTSVGYQRVYGKYCTVLNNHLVVAHFETGEYDAVVGIRDPYDARTTPFKLGWSHLNNPDQFFATDINEADEYPITEQYDPQFSNLGITGLVPWRNQAYVFLPSAIYTMYYIGFPVVFKIDPLNSNVGSIFSSGVVRTPRGVYFIGADNVYRITGTEPEPIGWQSRLRFFEDMSDKADAKYNYTWGMYDPDNQEVVWTYFKKMATGVYQAKQMIYREESGLWFFRNIPSASNTGNTDLFTAGTKYTSSPANPVMIYGGQGTTYEENPIPVITDTVNAAGVTSSVEPVIETQILNYGSVFRVKETSALHLDASWAHSAGLEVQYWADDLVGGAVPVWLDVDDVWTPAIPEGRVTFPTVPYRHICFRFKFLLGAALYVGSAIFNLWEEFVYGLQDDREK